MITDEIEYPILGFSSVKELVKGNDNIHFFIYLFYLFILFIFIFTKYRYFKILSIKFTQIWFGWKPEGGLSNLITKNHQKEKRYRIYVYIRIYVHTHTHTTKCVYKCIQPIYTYIYKKIYIYIYIYKHKTNLNAHPYLNIPTVKKHIKDNVKINCNLVCQKKVNSSSDSNSLIFNF